MQDVKNFKKEVSSNRKKNKKIHVEDITKKEIDDIEKEFGDVVPTIFKFSDRNEYNEDWKIKNDGKTIQGIIETDKVARLYIDSNITDELLGKDLTTESEGIKIEALRYGHNGQVHDDDIIPVRVTLPTVYPEDLKDKKDIVRNPKELRVTKQSDHKGTLEIGFSLSKEFGDIPYGIMYEIKITLIDKNGEHILIANIRYKDRDKKENGKKEQKKKRKKKKQPSIKEVVTQEKKFPNIVTIDSDEDWKKLGKEKWEPIKFALYPNSPDIETAYVNVNFPPYRNLISKNISKQKRDRIVCDFTIDFPVDMILAYASDYVVIKNDPTDDEEYKNKALDKLIKIKENAAVEMVKRYLFR